MSDVQVQRYMDASANHDQLAWAELALSVKLDALGVTVDRRVTA
jgi:hypothetical protein